MPRALSTDRRHRVLAAMRGGLNTHQQDNITFAEMRERLADERDLKVGIGTLRLAGTTAPFVLDGPMNGAAFLVQVERVLGPALGPGDVVVMDNLPAHEPVAACEAIDGARGDRRRAVVALRASHWNAADGPLAGRRRDVAIAARRGSPFGLAVRPAFRMRRTNGRWNCVSFPILDSFTLFTPSRKAD